MLRLTIKVEIPALDRLLAYLEGREQAGIDALTKRAGELTVRLAKHRTALQGQIEQENT